LLTTALQHLELLSNGRIASSHISLEDYKAAGAMDQNSEGIVNEVGRVDSALIAVFFREPKPGKIRVSVRSRGNIDVAAVCRQFGGGGHINAAGCTFESSLEEAKRALIPALEKCLESC
jgi:bifunctional oligoribonuclease and PAP phosphatase NrnA